MISKNFTEEKINSIVKEVDQEVIKIEYEAAQESTMIDGIDKILETLKKKKLKQAIFTFNTKKNAQISLDKVNLLHYFNIIVGRDNVKNAKPHPEHLETICSFLGVKTNEIIVIGDTSRDVEAALKVNAKSIYIKNKLFFRWDQEIINEADKIIEENEISSKLLIAIEELLNEK